MLGCMSSFQDFTMYTPCICSYVLLSLAALLPKKPSQGQTISKPGHHKIRRAWAPLRPCRWQWPSPGSGAHETVPGFSGFCSVDHHWWPWPRLPGHGEKMSQLWHNMNGECEFVRVVSLSQRFWYFCFYFYLQFMADHLAIITKPSFRFKE